MKKTLSSLLTFRFLSLVAFDVLMAFSAIYLNVAAIDWQSTIGMLFFRVGVPVVAILGLVATFEYLTFDRYVDGLVEMAPLGKELNKEDLCALNQENTDENHETGQDVSVVE